MSLLLRKKVALVVVVLVGLIGGALYLRTQVYYSIGKGQVSQKITIAKGENALEIGRKLKVNKLITNSYYFVFYLWKEDRLHNFRAGEFEIKPGLTIPEVATLLQEGNELQDRIKVTFPEGWQAKQMAERLTEKGLPGAEFLELVKKPTAEILSKHANLNDLAKNETLEGYLFPDTYYFAKNATAQGMIQKILDNFDLKLTQAMLEKIKADKKTLPQILTMASILEGEVRSDADRKIVSGIFWQRLQTGQPLQSCATLAYILGENKKQYSITDTQVQSPFNTYRNKGLPPAPISNPGISAIAAAIYPENSNYNYFLSDPETGNTVFSATFAEHVANKAKYGL